MAKFDDAFQEQLAAHYFRDDNFVQSVGTLVEPEQFENETLAALVSLQRVYLTKYGSCCTLKTFVQILQRAVAKKSIKIADMLEVKRLLTAIHADPLSDRDFVIDTVAEFARKQALGNAAIVLVDALDNDDDAAIDTSIGLVEEASNIGALDAQKAHDFVSGRDIRQARRAARLNGSASALGISTGIREFDEQLTPHMGWGRKELSILMGPPKSGKTAAMLSLAVNAAQSGKNVYYASCEVSDEILSDRMDANISGIPLKEIDRRAAEVDAAVEAWEKSPGLGKLVIESFPIKTLKVSDLKRILSRFSAQGIDFDLIVVDYGDILAPELNKEDKRHELAQIFQDLRALATTLNAAMLTATQTNREGTKKAARNVTDGTDAAEDYEKVRTADALITINASPDDRQNDEVVLYFSEMRNAESGLRLRFGQNFPCMRFFESFIGID